MEKVIIMGIPYPIEEKEIIGDNTDGMGVVLYHNQVIQLKKDLGKETKEQTLMHEIVHGLLYAIGEIELNSNERFVQSLSSGLYMLIKDNDFSFMNRDDSNVRSGNEY